MVRVETSPPPARGLLPPWHDHDGSSSAEPSRSPARNLRSTSLEERLRLSVNSLARRRLPVDGDEAGHAQLLAGLGDRGGPLLKGAPCVPRLGHRRLLLRHDPPELVLLERVLPEAADRLLLGAPEHHGLGETALRDLGDRLLLLHRFHRLHSLNGLHGLHRRLHRLHRLGHSEKFARKTTGYTVVPTLNCLCLITQTARRWCTPAAGCRFGALPLIAP